MERITRSRSGWTFAAVCFLLVAFSGCNSGSGMKGSDAQTGESSADTGHIDALCIGDLINKPTEAFHYSYKYTDASGAVDDEADVTPQELNITKKDKFGTQSFDAVRSNKDSWDHGLLFLAHLNFTGMSARLDSLNGTSAIGSQGSETVNGYSVMRYSIDTTRANSSDRGTFEMLWGKGSFDKGTIWMGTDGCMVKLALDEGLHQTDGGIAKSHYEIARVKK
ncbi:MAG: hypothetical protein ACYDD2_01105 [Candidatus Acidiferrales bacterium]